MRCLPNNREREKMSGKQVGLLLGISVLVGIVIKFLLPPAIPFLLGWILAIWVLPATKWIEKKFRIKRGISGGILIGLITIFLGYGIVKGIQLLLKQLRSLITNIKIWTSQSGVLLKKWCTIAEQYTGIEEWKIESFVLDQVDSVQIILQQRAQEYCMEGIWNVVNQIIVWGGGIIVTIIFGILLVQDMEDIRNRMEEGPVLGRISAVGKKVYQAGGKYLKAQGLLMIIIALVCMIGLWIIGNPYFVISGLIVGVLDALPVIGAGMILIPWALIWVLKGNYMVALGYFLLYLLVDLIRQFLEPKILGKEIGLHPAWMLISVYGGFFLYGFAGFILGPISVVIIQTLWKELKVSKEKNRKNAENS